MHTLTRVRMVVKLCTHWRMKPSGRNSCSRTVPGILIPPAEKLRATDNSHAEVIQKVAAAGPYNAWEDCLTDVGSA